MTAPKERKIRTILFPTDFTECAQQAFSQALFFAEQHGAKLHVLHAAVLHEDDFHDPSHHFPEAQDILERLFEIRQSELERFVREAKTGPLAICEVTRRGYSPGEVILDYAVECDADLIIMATHGRRGFGRAFLGSVAEMVVRHSRCPVLTVRARGGATKLEELDTIVAPIDFSRHSERALAEACELAAVYGSKLLLLHVVEILAQPYFYVPSETEIWGRRQKRSAAELERIAAAVVGDRVPFECHVAVGRPASEILRFADEHGADLIVMATQGLTGFEHFLAGSTTAEVVRKAKMPVWTVRAVEEDAATDSGEGPRRAQVG